MSCTHIAVAATLLIAGSLSSAAPAQDTEAVRPSPPTATSPPNPLAGPSLATAPAPKPTLVQRDFAGKLVRLDVAPAEAAVKVIELNPPTRAKIDAILIARAAVLDQIVSDNLELLVRLQGVRDAADKSKARETYQELIDKSEPLRARGTLVDELTGALSVDQAAQVRSMTQKYVAAAIAQRVADKTAGKDLSFREKNRAQREAAREETLALIGQEFRRAYERTVGQRAADFETLLKDFSVTPEQESKIRKIVQDNFTSTYGKPTPQQRAKAFWEVYAMLDEPQRQQLLKRVAEERAGSRAK